MIDFRPALFVIGILLTTLSVAMLAPFAIDIMDGHPDWQVFAGAGLLTLFVGGGLGLTNRSPIRRLSIRQAFILTAASWLALTTFAALPFVFSDLKLTYADAFFEAMSGITTTGSSVITGLDQAPKGIRLWRALLQWPISVLRILSQAWTPLSSCTMILKQTKQQNYCRGKHLC